MLELEQVIFGLHTAEFKRWITLKESNLIKSFFGLRPDEKLTGSTHFYQKGITKIWIEEIPNKRGF